jgi:hypothetical protein
VPRLHECPEEPEAHLDLPVLERRIVIDLADREVGIASARSSTAGADLPGIDPEHGNRGDGERADPERHHPAQSSAT